MEIDNANITKSGDAEPILGDDIPKSYVERATAELKTGCRITEVIRAGKPFKIRIEHPSIADEMLISQAYTAEFNKLLKMKDAEGKSSYFSRVELEKELRDRGVITVIDETKLKQLTDSLRKVVEDYNLMLVEGKTPQKKLDSLRAQYYDLRDKLFVLNSEMSQHYVNTIEAMAEQKQVFQKMVLCVKDIQGNPIWTSLDDLYNDKSDRLFISQCMQEAQMFWSNISREVLYDLPSLLEELVGGGASENLQDQTTGKQSS